MKTTLITFLFLLIALLSYSHVSGNAAPDVVRDTNGDILRVRTAYLILPCLSSTGGGITLASLRNETCPLDVVQSLDKNDSGVLPLEFYPRNSKKGVIRESTDLTISFAGEASCVESLIWKLVNYNGENIVSTRGLPRNPGAETWFKIEKHLSGYKIIFCPTVCKTCKSLCGNIGISAKNGARRLVLTDEPFMIKFVKTHY